MLKRLTVAAVIALVAGPAYSFHHLGRLDLPSTATATATATARAPAFGAVASLNLEPLLPSGRF